MARARALPFALVVWFGLASGAAAQQQPPPQPAPPPTPPPAGPLGLPPHEPAPAAAPAPAAPPSPTDIDHEEPSRKEPATRWGIGFRSRFVFMPSSVLNLFLAHSTSMSSVGFGGELIRRKGNFDIVMAVEYENVSPSDGYYEEKGEDPGTGASDQQPDYVRFKGFSLFSGDITFVWHTDIADFLQFRYGAGIGLGAVLGKFTQQDALCDFGTSLGDLDAPPLTSKCPLVPGTEHTGDKPPVVPIVHLLTGFRFKIVDQVSLNLEFGFRDVFFAGGGIGYFF